MAQITTTNRQAILELISQADETTEVAGLSASVTQLQIEVAGLSASIGNEINLGDFIVVDVPSGVATFSASASITIEATDGANTITNLLDATNAVSNTTAADGVGNTSSVGIGKTAINLTSTDGNGISNIDLAAGSSIFSQSDSGGNFANISFQSTDATIQSSDGTNTGTILVESSGSITTTSTDGTNSTNFQLSPTGNTLQSTNGTDEALISQNPTGMSSVLNDGNIELSKLEQLTTSIVSTVTDGTNTTTQNIGPTGFDTTTTDGANSVAFVADYSQFNIELYDDNVGTTAYIGVDTSQSSMGANDGTGTASSIVVQPASIQLNTTDGSVYTSTIDMDASSGLIQITSQDFSSSNITTETIDTTSIQSTVTDGTRTSRLHLDPNQVSSSTKFEIDDTTLQSGTGLVLNPDQSYQWGGDYNYSGTTYSENYVSGQEQYLSTITDNKISQINLDPASLNTGTLFKSEDLSVGSSAILSLGYDGQSSFDMIDGVGGSSNLTFTPTTILMSATDGSTFTSTLEIDPLEAGNFTNLSTSDGTTVNKLQVSQGDATLTSSIGGITQSSVITQPASIELTSTDGTNTSTQTITPTQITIEKTDGTYTHKLDFYDTGAIDLFMTDGSSTNGGLYIMPNLTQIQCGGTAGSVSLDIKPTTINMTGIPAFDDDADAATGGLAAGDMYQTTGLGANPLDVAGILMIKQ